MKSVKKKSTSMNLGMHLEKRIHEGRDILEYLNNEDVEIYKEMLESLFYLSTETRADLAFVCSRLEQILSAHSLTKKHWDIMFHVYSYLADNLDLGIVYDGSTFNFEGHTDSDWAESYVVDVRRS